MIPPLLKDSSALNLDLSSTPTIDKEMNEHQKTSQNLPSMLSQFKHIPFTVWILGVMMLLVNISSLMVYSTFVGFATATFGMGYQGMGRIEGIAEATSYVMKLLSGIVSDYLSKRKFVMVLGYIMIILSRPILAMAGSSFSAVSGRILERIGNGVQGTPRDAWVSDVTPAYAKGASYGMKRTIGVIGSIIGGFVATAVLQSTNNNFRAVFWYALIPAILSILLLLFFLKEPKIKDDISPKQDTLTNDSVVSSQEKNNVAPKSRFRWSDLKLLDRNYWLLMVIVFLFMLSRIGETFLIMLGQFEFNMGADMGPRICTIYNITYALSSYPLGLLADRLDRNKLLFLGVLILVISDTLLATAGSILQFNIGVALWGAQMGMVQSVFMTMIAALAPKNLRGTAFGFFYLISAVGAYLAGELGGTLAKSFDNVRYAFGWSLTTAVITLITVYVLSPKTDHTHQTKGKI